MKPPVKLPLSLLLILAVIGCGDPLLERQGIARLRVLGARYEPEEDPGRASPLPGEPGRVRWLVAGPGGSIDVDFDLFACSAREQVRGIPTCAQQPIAQASGRGAEPALELEVPLAPRLLFAGGFCTEGEVLLTPELSSSGCADSEAEGEVATYELDVVEDPASAHRHPDLTDTIVRLNGVPWDAEQPPCVSAQEEHIVRLRLPATARDPRPSDTPGGPWETLQVSHLSTEGRFERPFTVFGGDASDLDLIVTWQAPETPSTAHLYFVVRDLRGGVSWLSRQVCVE